MKDRTVHLPYQPPRSLREEPVLQPTEMEVQALWFEQLYQPLLATDDGRTVEIVQPGFWNHGGGPDFTRAVARFRKNGKADDDVTIGNVEVHLRAADWNAHGHHADAAYNETILHVVWESKGGKAFFPATAAFHRVPQIVLGSQLVAPWPELQPLCASLLRGPLPGAVPGRCSPELARLPSDQIADILRAAGFFRLRQKALRWYWRQRLIAPAQCSGYLKSVQPKLVQKTEKWYSAKSQQSGMANEKSSRGIRERKTESVGGGIWPQCDGYYGSLPPNEDQSDIGLEWGIL